MEKKKPEDIARDFENIDFAEIEADDLREIFGRLTSPPEEDCGGGTNAECTWPPPPM